jgi:CBS domain-containing protein
MLAETVRDIMQADVTTVRPATKVTELTRMLADRRISGAPVVEADRSVVGVVSASDIVRVAAEARAIPESGIVWLPRTPPAVWPTDDDEPADPTYGDFFLPEEGLAIVPRWRAGPSEGGLADMTVEEIMTPIPFSVEPTATLRELAGFLLRGRIHRAVVTEHGRLIGIVTTMDILRAIVNTP